MKSITHNEPITKVALPEQPLPVLVPVNKEQMEYRRVRGAIEAEDGYFYEDVERKVSVRLVSEELQSLTQENNRVAFEAKYGFALYDNTLNNAFFCLMLAEAVAGQDPKSGVRRALEFYRGPRPSDLFKEGEPVSKGIQQEPFRAVLEMLNGGLGKVRPVVWWSSTKKRASLGLYCPNVDSALFALALREMGMPGGLGVCQRCGNPFHRSRRTQRYCSHRCQLADSMRRYRKRHATRRNRNKQAKFQGRKVARRKK